MPGAGTMQKNGEHEEEKRAQGSREPYKGVSAVERVKKGSREAHDGNLQYSTVSTRVIRCGMHFGM